MQMVVTDSPYLGREHGEAWGHYGTVLQVDEALESMRPAETGEQGDEVSPSRL